MEISNTDRREWAAEGRATLSTIFSVLRGSFKITNSVYLVVGVSRMVFKKQVVSDIVNILPWIKWPACFLKVG
jgi:hypothetical protein